MKRLLKRLLKGVIDAVPTRSTSLDPSLFGLAALPDGGLALGGVALHPLLAEWGSPLHVVSAEKLRENARAYQGATGAGIRPEIFYSYKTNPVPGVLSILHGLGVGAEVISHYELWLARKLGVSPDKIVYNGPAKSDESIRDAVRLGVETLNVNHPEEIPRVARLAAEVGKKLKVGVRVTAAEGWTAQFGAPIEGGAALAAFREALASPWLEVVGLHAHRGGMILSERELLSFVDGVLDFTSELHTELGLELRILNLGGSLGTPTVRHIEPVEHRLNRAVHRPLAAPDPESALSIERHVALISERVLSLYRARGAAAPRVFLEPGRSMTGNTQLLLATVLSIKDAPGAPFAILDAGINHAESVRSEYHALLPVTPRSGSGTRVYTVVGPICSPGDTLYPAAHLPELRPGDSLAIMDSGAYFVPFSTSFSFPRPAIVLVDGGTCRPLRRRERFEDLVAYDE